MTFVRFFVAAGLMLLYSLAHANQTNILVMGDSLSAGYGINVEKGWVNLLQQELAKKSRGNIINASVSGETSSGGVSRLPSLLNTHKPAIVIIELGGNDGLRGQPLKLMQENLQTMITASKNAGAKVLLVGMQIPTNYGQRYTTQFRETFASLAEKNQIPLVPFLLEGVATQSHLMQNDGIHPNVDAQPIIVNNVRPFIEKML